MKRIVFFFSLFYIILFTGCNNLTNEMVELKNSDTEVSDIKLDKNGFLIFKDQATYERISSQVDKMNDQDFLQWERSIGFKSAQSFLNEAYSDVEKCQTLEQFEALKQKYEGKLVFTEDLDIRLPFYATAWSRVLSPEGIMKIGDMLYKFDQEKQISIIGGEYIDLVKDEIDYSDSTKIRIFYPNKNDEGLKSTILPDLVNGVILSNDKKTKLEYYIQVISYYYTGTGLGYVYYTEVGYQLKLFMFQKRKNIFGIWYKNKTIYYLRDYYLNCMYEKMIDFVPNGISLESPYVYHSESIGYQETQETDNGAVLNIFDYYDCDSRYYRKTHLYIYNLDATFNSRGIEVEKSVTIHCPYTY